MAQAAVSVVLLPDITLGLAQAAARLPALRLDSETIFQRPFRGLRLAIGVNGKHWTLTKVCHSE